jgi:hypothetical protein
MELRESVLHLGQRMDHLEQRMDTGFATMERRFTWVVGMQMTTIVAILGALLARG